MKAAPLHQWNVSYREAIRLQESLRSRVILGALQEDISHVAGLDIAWSRSSRFAWAGVVVMTYPELHRVEETWAEGTVNFPYLPGLLGFREIPLLLKALEKLRYRADLLLCDGQGIAHPRGLGLASHLGILLDTPTIGCAKTRLVGTFSPVGARRGDWSALQYKGKTVGAVVTTRTGVAPMFISPGYAVTVDGAVRMALACGGRYRVPEPIRQAHLLANRLRQEGD